MVEQPHERTAKKTEGRLLPARLSFANRTTLLAFGYDSAMEWASSKSEFLSWLWSTKCGGSVSRVISPRCYRISGSDGLFFLTKKIRNWSRIMTVKKISELNLNMFKLLKIESDRIDLNRIYSKSNWLFPLECKSSCSSSRELSRYCMLENFWKMWNSAKG